MTAKNVIHLGDRAKERLTGVSGIVMGITSWLTGCDHIGIRRTDTDKDGKPWDVIWFDEPNVERVAPWLARTPGVSASVALGDRAIDQVSGVTGIVIGITRYMHACDSVALKREGLDGKGEPWPLLWFEAPHVELLEPSVFPESAADPATGRKNGGPIPNGR